MAMPLRILILGGTTEASTLARLVANDTRFTATLSFAGRTAAPRRHPLPMRIGGFGGIDGLSQFLRDQRIAVLVDATHPYAAQISRNAVEASAATGVPLVSLVRPAWNMHLSDNWQMVCSFSDAAAALGSASRRVFLSLGRQELRAFAAAPQHHYLARVIDLPEQADLPPDLHILQALGPFDRAAELDLLRRHRIDVVVSKNAGGTATYAKIEAARELGLPVIMIARPDKPAGEIVASAEETVAWLVRHLSPPSCRGV